MILSVRPSVHVLPPLLLKPIDLRTWYMYITSISVSMPIPWAVAGPKKGSIDWMAGNLWQYCHKGSGTVSVNKVPINDYVQEAIANPKCLWKLFCPSRIRIFQWLAGPEKINPLPKLVIWAVLAGLMTMVLETALLLGTFVWKLFNIILGTWLVLLWLWEAFFGDWTSQLYWHLSALLLYMMMIFS